MKFLLYRNSQYQWILCHPYLLKFNGGAYSYSKWNSFENALIEFNKIRGKYFKS